MSVKSSIKSGLRTAKGKAIAASDAAVKSPNAMTMLGVGAYQAVASDAHQARMAQPIPGKATGPKFPKSAEGRTMIGGTPITGGGKKPPVQNEDETETEGEDMQLNAQERTELVDNLITNCRSWQFEGADEVLNSLPDENLMALNTDANLFQESAVVFNQLQKDFRLNGDMQLADVPRALRKLVTNAPGAAYDGSGGGEVAGKGGEEGEEEQDDDRESSDEGDSEMDDRDGEGEYAGDQQTKDSHQGQTRNRRNQRMTTREWMAAAPPEIQVAVRNALRIDEERKASFIETITANAQNPYSPEQLDSMTTEQLEPLARLATPVAPVRNASARQEIRDFFTEPARQPVRNGRADYRGAAAPINNKGGRSAVADDDDDGPLLIQNTNWKELNKELHAK